MMGPLAIRTTGVLVWLAVLAFSLFVILDANDQEEPFADRSTRAYLTTLPS